MGALHQLRLLNIRVIFEQENLDTADIDNDLMISIIESIAQAENESRSDNIKWGIKQKAAQGTSKLYNRKCYGYENDADGELIINEEEVKNVKLIFDLYLQGNSIVGIIKELENRGIKTPIGKGTWGKRTVYVMLSNEKYIGLVRLSDKGDHEVHYVSKNNHAPIISKELFEAVQMEKKNRSNVVKTEDGVQRNNRKYSSRKNYCKGRLLRK